MNYFDILFQMKTGKKVPYSKDYFDTLFAAKLAEMQIKTLTGTLPLTFRTSETALRSWTIYGNNTPHIATSTAVLPLTFTTVEDKLRDWEIRGNDESYQMLSDSIGQQVITCDAGTTVSTGITGLISLDAGSYTIHYYQMTSMASNTRNTLSILSNATGTQTYENGSPNHNLNAGWYSWTFDISTAGYYQLRIWINTPSDETKATNFILTKGETQAPDHYIPYQQGVGQRTENLFDCRKNSHGSIDSVVAGVQFQYANQSITLSQTANGRYPQQQILGENGILMLENGTQYYGKLYIENAPENANIYMLLHASTDGTNYTTITTIRSAGVTFTPNDDYTVYRWLFVAEGDDITYNNTVVKFAIVKGNTAPAEYVPYGYEIPISVNGTPQTFYIGDSPLTAGQSISKTSTGVDIATTEGENTISTTLYNKPETAISFVDYVGVGEKSGNDWQIPLSVSCNRNLFDIMNNLGSTGGVTVSSRDAAMSAVTATMSNQRALILGYTAVITGNDTFVLSFDKTTSGAAELRIVKGSTTETFDISEAKSYSFTIESQSSYGGIQPFLVAGESGTYTFEKIMIRKANDAGGFVPYGAKYTYSMPIDAPLTEGQSITDTQTISTFEGANTLDTSLTNKPSMSITYKGG